MDPGPFFYYQSTINYLLFCVYFLQTITFFHSIRLILCFQQNWWDWQPHRKLGTEFCGCVVQVSTLLLALVVRPTNVQLATPLVCFLAPTGLIKPWFHTEVNLMLCSSYLPLGVPNKLYINHAPAFFWRHTQSHQAFFWRRCRGVKDIFTRGVPHNQSLYFVIFVLLSSFLLCLLVLL